MKRTSSGFQLESEFGDFLFAPIADDRNGMMLSVLSALARLNLDPWEEAAKLVRLPKETAIEQLAALIAALPDGPSARPDPGTVAARLFALLPHPTCSNIGSWKTFPRIDTTTSRTVLFGIFYAILTFFMLSAPQIINHYDSPGKVHNASAPVTSAVSRPSGP